MVGSGGFLGALARYGLSGLVHRQVRLTTFPYGTLVVNLMGCFAIGVVSGLAECRQLFGPELRTFTLIGILGGFTTFSTLGSETFAMIRGEEYLGAGATVLRGLESFGAHSPLHTAKVLRLSSDLPIVVEIVDTENKIESFLPLIDDAIGEGLATVERVEVRFYRSGSLQGLTRVPNEDG